MLNKEYLSTKKPPFLSQHLIIQPKLTIPFKSTSGRYPTPFFPSELIRINRTIMFVFNPLSLHYAHARKEFYDMVVGIPQSAVVEADCSKSR
jgi:hypothetical protein